MGHRYNNILETIGGTPVVKVDKLAPKGINLFVKIESFNPMGSVKDRLALGIIEAAESDGSLKSGQTVIEATSGNTGIGLAMVCAQKGYPLVITMSESFSVERRKMIRFLGAKVILTPAHLKGKGMVDKAEELAKKNGWFLTRQFENEANPDMHTKTTAVEILDDFSDTHLDYWVTGFGTGGTLKGVSRVLKEKSPQTQVIVCEPDNSAILASSIPQERNPDGSIVDSHPRFRPHLMQGWSPDFIPKLTEDAVKSKLIDKLLLINGNDALKCSEDLSKKEGIFVGITAGATLAGALQIAKEAKEGANILVMLPDTGERYMSTPLFYDIPEEMTEEEWDISRSTPTARFDVPAPVPAQEKGVQTPDLDKEALAYVEKVIHDAGQPVVLFALEWCEFCWSVRKLFKKLQIEYLSVDMDNIKFQDNDRGSKIRAVISEKTGIKTIPQVFVGGEFIGGATDTFDAFKDKSLQQRFKNHNVKFNESASFDPYSLLPGWLQPR